ncbi:MAG: DUF5103 domain-containing protein [Ignavibacteria bacterium]|nr:DUF5103 domain-containing protein [Ignavibacteria bacterium]
MKVKFSIMLLFALMKVFLILHCCDVFCGNSLIQNDDLITPKDKPIVRFIRIYGEQGEQFPPIIIIRDDKGTISQDFSGGQLVVEFDVASQVPPNLFARFFHCSYDWKENENVFINEVSNYRTSDIFWQAGPSHSRYYNFRGTLKIPNQQIKFKYAGNWKVKLFDYNDPEKSLAEAKFFVVLPLVNCELRFYSDFYTPERNVTASAFHIEALVYSKSSSGIVDNYIHSVGLYRNHRWNEPFFISQYLSTNYVYKYKYEFDTQIFGFIRSGKVFRIGGIPAENGYRVIDLTNLVLFPSLNAPIRLPLSDIRRRGSFFEPHDDGAMTTTFISPNYDEYVYLEFVLDTEGWEVKDEVFISGSFNNWTPSVEWKMFYDDRERVYKLRQWVRRARHNYLYATGVITDDGKIESLSYDELEGNTVTSGHTFFAFVYYRNPAFGGYDEIIGVAKDTYFSARR